jgi:lysophospholipase L1-like esterase
MTTFSKTLVRSLILSAAFATFSHAAESTATTPAPRDANWMKRHEGFLALTNKPAAKVLFLGDSITDGWRSKGKAVWEKNYAPLNAINLGIGGDRTQHVLWRMENGELEGIKPKAVVLMIGTNNTGKEKDGSARNATPEIIEGVTAIVKGLRKKMPEARILLLAIFPRGQKGEPIRDQLAEINKALSKLDDGKMVNYLDIGQKFLEADGTLSKDIMPDLLHPNEKGYEIWADAIKEPLAKLLK